MCLSATSIAVAATDEDVGQLTDEDYENLLTFRATCAVARLVSSSAGCGRIDDAKGIAEKGSWSKNVVTTACFHQDLRRY
jgi:hypothetical protein